MSTTDMRLQGPVDIRSDSRERVAFELMERIARAESEKPGRDTRDYWFKLYNQSFRTVLGNKPADVLKE